MPHWCKFGIFNHIAFCRSWFFLYALVKTQSDVHCFYGVIIEKIGAVVADGFNCNIEKFQAVGLDEKNTFYNIRAQQTTHYVTRSVTALKPWSLTVTKQAYFLTDFLPKTSRDLKRVFWSSFFLEGVRRSF